MPQKINEDNLLTNLQKCHFAKTEIERIVLKFTQTGISQLESKVAAVLAITTRTTLKRLRWFHGFVDYISRNTCAKAKKISSCDEYFIVPTVSKIRDPFKHYWKKKPSKLHNLNTILKLNWPTSRPTKPFAPQTLLSKRSRLQEKIKLLHQIYHILIPRQQLHRNLRYHISSRIQT